MTKDAAPVAPMSQARLWENMQKWKEFAFCEKICQNVEFYLEPLGASVASGQVEQGPRTRGSKSCHNVEKCKVRGKKKKARRKWNSASKMYTEVSSEKSTISAEKRLQPAN